MKKLFLIALIAIFANTKTNAQLTDWQKQHAGKVVFFDNWLQSRLDENDADASTEIEFGNDFWFRAYFDDASRPKVLDNHLDIRLSCEGEWVTLNEMMSATTPIAEPTKGVYPNFVQIQLPGLDNFWKTRNVFSCNGFAQKGQYDNKTDYGCTCNSYFSESLLRFLLAKIDKKIIPGAVLNIKYEMVNRTKGNYGAKGGTYESLAEGTLKLRMPTKEKALTTDVYRFLETPGMADQAMEAKIKAGILALNPTTIKDISRLQIQSNAYKIQKNGLGVPLNRWVVVRILYSSALTGETLTGTANVTFTFNGSDYDTNVQNVYFNCGHIYAPSYAAR